MLEGEGKSKAGGRRGGITVTNSKMKGIYDKESARETDRIFCKECLLGYHLKNTRGCESKSEQAAGSSEWDRYYKGGLGALGFKGHR